jgi:DNA-binding MarR family transcriptional regulator
MGTHTVDRDPIRRALDAIRQIVRVLRLSAAHAERELGLSGAQLFVLQKLGDGNAISVNELAERTHTHQSSVSVVVQRLVRRRLIRRVRSSTDARRAELSITAAGLQKLRRAPAAAQDKLIESLTSMPRAECDRLARLLERLVEGTGMSQAAPALFFEDKPQPKRRSSRHGGQGTGTIVNNRRPARRAVDGTGNGRGASGAAARSAG